MGEVDLALREELVDQARKVVPLLRSRAVWIDENGCLPTDVVDGLEAAGVFRISAPRQFGGLEADVRTWLDVCTELARGSVSTAWVVGVTSLQSWLAAMWPDEAQEEVFANPNVRLCGTGPLTATARRVDGGYVVNGSWPFSSGAPNGHWKISAAKRDDAPPIMVLMPMADLECKDDWSTVGMSGTGSVTVTAHDVFVPDRLVLERSALQGAHPGASSANAGKAVYQLPLRAVGEIGLVGAFLGASHQALAAFLERLPGRAISHSNYTSQQDAPVTHLQVGEAAMLIEEAELRARAWTDEMVAVSGRAGEWTQRERVRAKIQGARSGRLCKQAVGILASASGGSSIYQHVEVTRIHRDIHAMSLHGSLNAETNAEFYGRELCGLEPNTAFL